ncbi:MAG: hypothetical protein WCX17_04035 [Parcubacteria group bacterium]|jgi:hypothetical protein
MTLSKKIFIISAILFAVMLIFLGVYNLSFKTTAPAPNEQAAGNNVAAPATPPAIETAKLTPISDEAVLSPILDLATSKIKYYSKLTGKVYSIDLDGTNKKTVSDKNLPGLVDVIWSPDGSKVITKFTQGAGNKFFYYDYATNVGVQLKDNLDTIVWQSNSKIFYKYYEPQSGERTLNIADPNGSNWVKITNLNYRFVSIAPIPHTGLVSFWNSPDASAETDFESSSVLGGENTPILKGYFGADYLWNASGNAVLVGHTDQKNGSQTQLAIMNEHGGELKNLGVSTFVSKSVWSKDNKTVYFALPGSLPSNATIPNDYLANKFNTDDSFWKINTITGEKTRIIDATKLSGGLDAMGLFLNADESMLFFANKVDGKLYRISL